MWCVDDGNPNESYTWGQAAKINNYMSTMNKLFKKLKKYGTQDIHQSRSKQQPALRKFRLDKALEKPQWPVPLQILCWRHRRPVSVWNRDSLGQLLAPDDERRPGMMDCKNTHNICTALPADGQKENTKWLCTSSQLIVIINPNLQ